MTTLSENQAKLFTDRNWGVIATIREDGSPHATPVWIDDARLVIEVERDKQTRLAVVDADDAWPRRLAVHHGELDAHGDEGEAAVSPDGTQVAYTFTPRADLNRSEIRVAAIDGGEVRSLTGTPRMHVASPAWSPDGTTVAYVSERSGFWERHLADQIPRQLEQPRGMARPFEDERQHVERPSGTAPAERLHLLGQVDADRIADDRPVRLPVARIADELRVPDPRTGVPRTRGREDCDQRTDLAAVRADPQMLEDRLERVLGAVEVPAVLHLERSPVQPADAAHAVAPGHARPVLELARG